MSAIVHCQFMRKFTRNSSFVAMVISTLMTLYILRLLFICKNTANLSAHKMITNNVLKKTSDKKSVAVQKSKAYRKEPPIFGLSETNLVLNPEIFHYLIPNEKKCKEKLPELLIGVQVSGRDVHQRVTARQTWANRKLLKKQNTLVLFFLGRVADMRLMKKIKQESDQYGDIVLDNYVDHYNNVTLKLISMLKWIKYYCPDLKWFSHSDGDTLVVIPKIKDWIRNKVTAAQTSRTPYVSSGYLTLNVTPTRSRKERNYMPMGQFPGRVYPPIYHGCAFLLNGAAAIALYDVSFGSHYVWLEDVFVTGILGEKIHLVRIPVPHYTMSPFPHSIGQVRLNKALFICHQTSKQITDLWRKIKG